MEQNMSKKEFRKKWKSEGSPASRYPLIGGILSVIGLAIIIVVFLLDMNTDLFLYLYPLQIVFYIIGLVISLTGCGLDLAADISFKKAWQAYQDSCR